ncbi:hypothetical protein [Chitinimonas sp.]|uniref:hypothetical protein n=1 Tax=Chitinimonas sp. TaxID=1934313 RepID=UPI0035ADE549
MNFQLQDLHRIKRSLSAALVSLALLIGVVVGGRKLEAQHQAQHEEAVSAASAAQAKAEAAVADRAKVDTYKTIVDSLRQRAVLGTEQRLPWVEYVTATSLTGNPVSLTVQISPRRILEDAPPSPEPLENLQLYASKFTLDSKLLHDLDAVRLIDSLRQMQGAFILRQCLLKRAPDGASGEQPYLMTFSCDGDIITIDKPANAPGAPS